LEGVILPSTSAPYVPPPNIQSPQQVQTV
jgi:hypothetical protein